MFFCGPDNLSSILLNHNITLMHSCKVDLVDVTLVVVDGNSKLIDVDVRVGNAISNRVAAACNCLLPLAVTLLIS